MEITERQREFMQEAIDISCESVRNGGGPFGAVIVRDGKVIGKGSNSVSLLNDPTAHAEVSAIRETCRAEGTFSLAGCDLYTSCEPCPMCLSAAYWAGIRNIYFGNTRSDAAKIGFDDSFIYEQIPLSPDKRSVPSCNIMRNEANVAFRMWEENDNKINYNPR